MVPLEDVALSTGSPGELTLSRDVVCEIGKKRLLACATDGFRRPASIATVTLALALNASVCDQIHWIRNHASGH
jgi:hypothetical protein